MKAEVVLELAEAPVEEAVHVVRDAGVDQHDALVRAGLRRYIDAAVALADVEKDQLDGPRGDDVLGADEAVLGAPLDLRPAVRGLIEDIEEIAPADVTELGRFVRFEEVDLRAVRAASDESRRHGLPSQELDDAVT
ncbi:MAG TPA: hypothetical protein VMO26_19855 [Vicinamibacterales bacterium]|nr:hypothetical protein [Vicinamibacterales bacterium]